MTGLEQELAASLGPVRAPASVWYRVEAALDARPARRRPWGMWAAVGLGAACLCAAIWMIPRGPASAVAIHQEFWRRPGGLDLAKCQPATLQGWLAQSVGLAVKLAARPAPDPDGIEIAGARRLADGRAAIFYRVGKYPVTLLVQHAGATGSKQVRTRNLERAGATVFEWGAHGQAYTLVSSLPNGGQQACHICHA